MKNGTRRFSLFVLILGLILLAGILFRSFLLDNLVQPVAFLAWLVMRIFLSIDQKVYWGVLIFASLVFIIRHFNHGPGTPQLFAAPDVNVTLADVRYWQSAIRSTQSEQTSQNLLKQRLVEMLIAAYGLQESEAAPYEVNRALASREIPLPDTVYTFLFDENPLPRQPLRRLLVQTQRAVQKNIRRWTGQEGAAYARSIGEVLAFIETALEMPYEPNRPND